MDTKYFVEKQLALVFLCTRTAFCHEMLHFYIIILVHRITVTFGKKKKLAENGWIINNGRSVQEYEFAKAIPIWLSVNIYKLLLSSYSILILNKEIKHLG